MKLQTQTAGMLLLALLVSCRKPKNIPIPEAIKKGETRPDSKQAPPSPTPSTSNSLCINTSVCSKPALPTLPAAPGFSEVYKKLLASVGTPSHRARDVLVTEGKPVRILGKFAYSTLDADLKDEPIDVYLSQGCNGAWKKITTVKTSQDDQLAQIEGVEDSGGRIAVELSSLGIKLPVGRHHVVLVVPADNSYSELTITVIPPNSKVIVTDIDGTLTVSEFAAATEIMGQQPGSHESAAALMEAFHKRGYHIFYLTARPEWLMQKTREWLVDQKFPPGTIHTSNSKAGATGDAAFQFKSLELSILKQNTGLIPAFAFGNKDSDVKAFGSQGIDPKQSFYFNLEGDASGGVIHKDYAALLNVAEQAPSACP